MPKILSVKPLPNYRLELKYDTNETKIFNALPYISGSWYGLLKDTEYFKTVHITNGGRGIE